MARRNHNSGNAAEFAHGKGKLRRRTQAVKHIRLDAVCVQAECRLIRKFGGHDSGIVGDRNALLLSVLGENVVRQSLCRLTHGINVHAVRSRSDHAAQSAGSKLQLTVKPIFNLRLIVLDGSKLCLCILVKIRVCAPLFVSLHVTHAFSLFSLIFNPLCPVLPVLFRRHIFILPEQLVEQIFIANPGFCDHLTHWLDRKTKQFFCRIKPAV